MGWLVAERRRVLWQLLAAIPVWAIWMMIAVHVWPPGLLPEGSALNAAVQLLALPAVILSLIFLACDRLFYPLQALDPLAGADPYSLRVHRQVLTNSVEQLAIFAPLLLAFAARVGPGEIKLLAALVVGWSAGRLAFWAGYLVGPVWRGFGMALTLFNPLALMWYLAADIAR